VLPRAPNTSRAGADEQLTGDYGHLTAAELPFSARLVTRIPPSEGFRYPPAAQCLHGLAPVPFFAFLQAKQQLSTAVRKPGSGWRPTI
jgi:hypothetical protein